MTLELIEHLRTRTEPLRVRRSGVIVWADEARHTAAFEADPAGYALLALMPGVSAEHRAQMLLRLLDASWAGLPEATRDTLNRVVRLLTLGLDGARVATVMLALRHRRANHKHVTRAALRLLHEHAHAAVLARTHRAVLTAVVEHALGKNTARGRAAQFPALYGGAPHGPLPAKALIDLDLEAERPATVTVTNRGDLAATFVHRLRGGASAELDAAAERYAAAAAATVPVFPGTLAVVVDESPSMRGYGDREWALLSQVHALRAVLRLRCADLVEVSVAGAGTDLATGVLDALGRAGTRPDVVAVVSDGYENVLHGDLARVTATLPRAGVTTPVVFCHSTFGRSDDLTYRRPAPGLPELAFWHEADFAPLMLWLLAQAGHGVTDAPLEHGVTDALLQRMKTIEGTVR